MAEAKGHVKSPRQTTRHGKPREQSTTAKQPNDTASGEGLEAVFDLQRQVLSKGISLDEALISPKY